MKIAYFIMAHHKPAMFLRLLNAIYAENHIYLIHIDSSADAEIHELANNLSQSNSNIRILPSRFLSWGGWSLIQVELDALTYLLNWDSDWSYYINLSGQDFPLVRQIQLEQFLLGKNSNYLTAKPINLEPNQKKQMQAYYRIEDCGKIVNLGERRPFEDYFSPEIEPYYGSQWKMITRAFAEYAATSHLSFEMQDYYRYTFIPDEAFFQTLLLNGDFKETHVNGNYRFINMQQFATAFQRPVVITMDYLQTIFQSDALFARKFDEDVDSSILDIIERSLGL
ncbi:beta-1,6-N-acetylglucosaminyltransferase [Paenibacillus vini]|uniref:Peptide O-xylosyltransferase n=1 Tax=Paenibacillus vini TaxID=1476024 RepID=A0ABQ4M6H4_9BACL|nr:beta-1,6-N-acetylglucosaminyltransferase [Paenibacillus vini]GIP51603.1 glycosyl transferase [Paenibacillus vini]